MRLRSLGQKLRPSSSAKLKTIDRARREKKVESFYVSSAWKTFIARVIAQRGRRCEGCGAQGCRIFGDHIRELTDGGEALEPSNIQLLCGSCHTTKTAAAKRMRSANPRPTASTNIRFAHTRMDTTLVCGPSRAGKNTYVKKHMTKGDLVVDLDALWSALSGSQTHDTPEANFPFACEARDAVYKRIAQGSPTPGHRCWIITQAATSKARYEIAQATRASRFVVLATPADVCIERLVTSNDPRPRSEMVAAIHRWWSEYEPDQSGGRFLLA